MIRVLIADDNAVIRQGVRALLTSSGDDIEVVVSDVNMKGMNGVELCRRLLEGRPQLPVILITAFGSMDLAIQAIRAGAYDFVPKPFEIDQLVLAIERGVTLAERRPTRAHGVREVAELNRS